MRRVKVLTAFLGAVISVTGSGVLFDADTINSVTVDTKIVEYEEEMTVTTAASIETTAVPETTTTKPVTTTTEETTTTTEETTTTTTETTTTVATTTEQTTIMTTAAPETTPAPQTTAAPETTAAEAAEAVSAEAVETTATTASNAITVSYSDYVLLCNVVAHEYGSDWVSTYDKALVVEVVMNRVKSSSFPNTIYGVLTQRYQFSGSSSYVNLGTFSSKVTASCKAAVDLYLSDPTQFNHGYLYFTGDGTRNYFH